MTPQLSIGFDAKRIVSNATGLGSYGRTLVNDLAASEHLDLHLYAPNEGRDDLRSQVLLRGNLQFHYGKPGVPALGTSLWRTHGIIKDLKRDGIQIYHGLSGELPIGIRKSGIKSVVTIHDLIFLRHPEFYHWIDTKIYAWKFRKTIKEADRIIAISECTKRDIIEYGHVDESRISLIYQSCAPRFSAEPDTQKQQEVRLHYNLPQRYILNVGSIEARKNIILAVKALQSLPEDLSLVIVGRHTKYTDQVIDYVNSHQLSHRVLILHGVPNKHLPAIYTQAEAFVYPSVYEGFGIPIIEAINCGLPVVACSGSCLEEAGGPDCFYVAPDNVEGMTRAIKESLRGATGREHRIASSQAYIRRFLGSDMANQMIELYHSLL